MHRVFIAINLPEKIKRGLAKLQSQWPELPAGWTKPENLHITLFFLGNLSDEEVLEVCNTTREVASHHQPFSINLNKTLYGPPKKPPRMVWVEGKKSEEFSALKSDLEKSLTSSEKIRFRPEKRAFHPHITLGRIRTWEFRRIEPEERPNVEQEISLNFEVSSIEVMESFLKKSGAEYIILESSQLGNQNL